MDDREIDDEDVVFKIPPIRTYNMELHPVGTGRLLDDMAAILRNVLRQMAAVREVLARYNDAKTPAAEAGAGASDESKM